MSRRTIWALGAAVAVAALLAGLGLGILNRTPTSAAVEQLTETAFDNLAGSKDSLTRWRGQILVVNFWATWCPPCRDEIPGLIRAQQKLGANGVQVVGIAIDSPAKARDFANAIGINYPLLVGGAETIDLARGLGNRAGALPYTVVLDRRGKLVATHLGVLSEVELARIVADIRS